MGIQYENGWRGAAPRESRVNWLLMSLFFVLFYVTFIGLLLTRSPPRTFDTEEYREGARTASRAKESRIGRAPWSFDADRTRTISSFRSPGGVLRDRDRLHSVGGGLRSHREESSIGQGLR